MPFSDFYLIFKVIFYLIKSQKKGFTNLQADMASGGRRGAQDRLGVRRGTEATWQSPGGPRGAQVVLTRGRRPRGRVHVGARVGSHVAGGFASGGPTGIVGPGNMGGQ